MLTQATSIFGNWIYKKKKLEKKTERGGEMKTLLFRSYYVVFSISLAPSQTVFFFVCMHIFKLLLPFLVIFEGCTKKYVEFSVHNLHNLCLRTKDAHTHMESVMVEGMRFENKGTHKDNSDGIHHSRDSHKKIAMIFLSCLSSLLSVSC